MQRTDTKKIMKQWFILNIYWKLFFLEFGDLSLQIYLYLKNYDGIGAAANFKSYTIS